jgi:hypothetical protein
MQVCKVEIYSSGVPRLESTMTFVAVEKLVADWRGGREVTISIVTGETIYLNGKLIASVKVSPPLPYRTE